MLPEDLLTALRALAVAQKTSVSHIARQTLTDAIPEIKNKRSAVEVLLEAAEHAYKGKAPRDLSTNDEYLYGLP